MTIDHRGFHYPLEPFRRRQTWRLETLKSRLSKANQDVAVAKQRLTTSTEYLQVQHGQLSQAATEPFDPAFQRRSLWWLAQLREKISGARTELAALQATCSQQRLEYVAEQNKLAAIDRHRSDCLAAYAQTEQNRQSSVADVDWLTRDQVTALAEANRTETA
jgi:hypothetical protein